MIFSGLYTRWEEMLPLLLANSYWGKVSPRGLKRRGNVLKLKSLAPRNNPSSPAPPHPHFLINLVKEHLEDVGRNEGFWGQWAPFPGGILPPHPRQEASARDKDTLRLKILTFKKSVSNITEKLYTIKISASFSRGVISIWIGCGNSYGKRSNN